jgi:hypothetical protein
VVVFSEKQLFSDLGVKKIPIIDIFSKVGSERRVHVNTGPKVQPQPNKKKSFFLFVQSCLIDKVLIVSELLLALIPQINIIIETQFINDPKIALLIHLFEFLSLLLGHLIQIK